MSRPIFNRATGVETNVKSSHYGASIAANTSTPTKEWLAGWLACALDASLWIVGSLDPSHFQTPSTAHFIRSDKN